MPSVQANVLSTYRRRVIAGLGMTVMVIVALSSGVYFVMAYVEEINRHATEVRFSPDVGAFFSLGAVLVYVLPILSEQLRLWVRQRRRIQHAMLAVFLIGAVTLYLSPYLWIAPRFEAGGYILCRDHASLHVEANRKHLLQDQIWVLDPNDCLVR